jgi:hypothetical protein
VEFARRYGGRVPEGNDEFYARVAAAADGAGRLPLPEQSMWEIFPFERESLRVKPIEPPVLPEPPRDGEGGRPCWRCAHPDEHVVWGDERWILAGFGEPLGIPFGAILSPRAHLDLGDLDDVHAADMGRLIVAIERAVQQVPGVGRVHVNKWGDGAAHLHLIFVARPAGLLQLRGSWLPMWEEMLPRLPDGEGRAALLTVAGMLARTRGAVRA